MEINSNAIQFKWGTNNNDDRLISIIFEKKFQIKESTIYTTPILGIEHLVREKESLLSKEDSNEQTNSENFIYKNHFLLGVKVYKKFNENNFIYIELSKGNFNNISIGYSYLLSNEN